jgi:hypothetical protein
LSDAFVTKWDSSGTLQWTRQFGTNGGDYGWGIGVDPSGNSYVTGYTASTFSGQSSAGGDDVFLAKHNASGTPLWTRQFGSNASDKGWGVSVDASGSAYVAVSTEGAFPGQSSAGNLDAVVLKYDSSGAPQWTRQFGTSAPDSGRAVSVDSYGYAYVAGDTAGALPGQSNAGGGLDAFIKQVIP